MGIMEVCFTRARWRMVRQTMNSILQITSLRVLLAQQKKWELCIHDGELLHVLQELACFTLDLCQRVVAHITAVVITTSACTHNLNGLLDTTKEVKMEICFMAWNTKTQEQSMKIWTKMPLVLSA